MSPAEPLTDDALEAVERALVSEPLIAEAAAVQLRSGERPWAVLRADPEHVRLEGLANLFEQLRFRAESKSVALPVEWRPRGWSVARDGLPHGPSGAPDRRRIADELGPEPGRAFPAAPPPSAPLPAAWQLRLRSWLGEGAEPGELTRSLSLELDLDLDSLERLDLILTVAAATGREIPDADPAKLFSLGDLVDYFGEEALQEGGPPEANVARDPGRVLAARDSLPAPPIALPARLSWPVLRMIRLGGLIWARRRLDFEVTGVERVDWSTRPMIVAQNHHSVLDGMLLALGLPAPVHRELFSVGYAGYFSQGRGRWAAKLGRIQPIDADSWALTGLRSSAAALRAGRVMAIYPEGERSNDGSLKPFRRSVAWLAAYSGAAVVPSALAGSYQAWPRGYGFAPHPVRMTFGPALPPPARLGDPLEEQAWLEALRSRIAGLMREVGADPERGDPETWRSGPPGLRP
jgi:1-acyl-sn-glycerol-3-phosphate acyltransferase